MQCLSSLLGAGPETPALDRPGTAVREGEPQVLLHDTLVLRVLYEAVTGVLLSLPAAWQGDGARGTSAARELPGVSPPPEACRSVTASARPHDALAGPLVRQRLVKHFLSSLEVELEWFDPLWPMKAGLLIICLEGGGTSQWLLSSGRVGDVKPVEPAERVPGAVWQSGGEKGQQSGHGEEHHEWQVGVWLERLQVAHDVTQDTGDGELRGTSTCLVIYITVFQTEITTEMYFNIFVLSRNYKYLPVFQRACEFSGFKINGPCGV